MNRDPFEEAAGLNLFAAMLNDPLAMVDPVGFDIYKTLCIHAKIIGDRPGGGCYTIEFTKPPELPYRIWNPGYYEFHEWPNLSPADVADVKGCKRIRTTSATDKLLYDAASRLGNNRDNPPYNFFIRNCQHFAEYFCETARTLDQNLGEYGTWYDPGHSRRNRPRLHIR